MDLRGFPILLDAIRFDSVSVDCGTIRFRGAGVGRISSVHDALSMP